MESAKFYRQLRDIECITEEITHHVEDHNPEEATILIGNLENELKILARRLKKEMDEE